MKITGTVRIQVTNAPLVDQRVELWAGEDLPRRIASGKTNAQGGFELAYEPSEMAGLTGEQAPRIALKFYQGIPLQDVVEGPGQWTAGSEPAMPLDVKVGPSTGERVVRGTLRHENGALVGGTTVRAYHRGFGAETALGSANT